MSLAALFSMMSSVIPLDPPTGALTTVYSGSLVQVGWTNANGGLKQTRVYRRFKGTAWTLLNTVAAGATSYQTGINTASGYTYGVSHYDPTTGQESAIAIAAVGTTPPDPTGVSTSLYQETKIQVNFDVSASYYTRGYKLIGGAWSLQTTLDPGVSAWLTAATSGTFAVSHYDPATGLESDLVSAA